MDLLQGTGFVIWLTGMTGAGKTTIATHIGKRFSAAGRPAEVIDGDCAERDPHPRPGRLQGGPGHGRPAHRRGLPDAGAPRCRGRGGVALPPPRGPRGGPKGSPPVRRGLRRRAHGDAARPRLRGDVPQGAGARADQRRRHRRSVRASHAARAGRPHRPGEARRRAGAPLPEAGRHEVRHPRRVRAPHRRAASEASGREGRQGRASRGQGRGQGREQAGAKGPAKARTRPRQGLRGSRRRQGPAKAQRAAKGRRG